ncbi:SURF1 family protein [Rothia nasimurium]|uniref:SURF1 family protein n=1 Tax=Rothia nasimurium TaxID=85336 RepID=UPI003BA3684E
MLKTALTPRWLVGLVAVLALVTGFVWLSSWQLSASTSATRSADPDKDRVRPYSEIFTPYSVLDLDEVDTVVEATGSYVPGSSYLVENKLNDGKQGYWVVALFIPDGTDTVTTSMGEGPRGLVVARAWTSEAEIPAEPTGTVTVAGRIVGNDAPLGTNQLSQAGQEQGRTLASANSSYLTNVWNTALFNGILTADSETNGLTPLTAEGTIDPAATVLGQSETYTPVRAEQVTNDSLDWLNIFYAIEWLVFAGFALYFWWRMLKDSVDKDTNPTHYFEYEGQYWVDEATGRPYYYDPADDAYYFFDQVNPAAGSQEPSR